MSITTATTNVTATAPTTAATSTVATSTVASTRGRYLAPTGGQRFFNSFASGLARMGSSMGGLHQLRVVGRRSGEVQTVPVSPLDVNGIRYLVAPRGATDWVLNARAAGEVELRSGRKVQRYTINELDNDEVKAQVLRCYLGEYTSTVKAFFEPLTPTSSIEEFLDIADGYPAFRLVPVD